MPQSARFRIADRDEFSEVAKLRWRLKMGDDCEPAGETFARYQSDFVGFEADARREGECFHWIAETASGPVAVMSAVVVRKLLSPDDEPGAWVYLTNCYVLPEARDEGLGSAMLAEIRQWAVQEKFELILVWPSDRAFPFYERAGFCAPNDNLVIEL